jgi:hypothetical protein
MELEEAHYHIGHNVPGYLPESDVFAADGVDEALSILESDLKEQEDYYYEQCPNGTVHPVRQDDNCDCDWCGVAKDVYADRIAIKERDMRFRILSDGGNLNLTYCPPEGPDLSFWVTVILDEESCDLIED